MHLGSMKSSWRSAAVLLPLLGCGINALPQLAERNPDATRDEYMVIINKNTAGPGQLEDVLARVNLEPSHPDIHYIYNNSAFSGFSATMSDNDLSSLSTMSHVQAVTRIQATSYRDTNYDTTWGLQRISSPDSMEGDDMEKMDFDYNYPDNRLGAGADIYVLDSGIRTSHQIFEGRARTGFTFDGNIEDQDGHGTHVAGTAAGAALGVASQANLIAVKVKGEDSGSGADALMGLDWIVRKHMRRMRRPGFVASILSMSIGWDVRSESIDQAFQSLASVGIHVVVAAGNSAADACETSPSSCGGANSSVIVVGSINVNGDLSSFTNQGPCVDVFAAGESVLSASNTGDSDIERRDGTSMACPHVSGVVAYYSLLEPSLALDPAAMKQHIRDTALTDISPENVLVAYNSGNGHPAKRLSRRQRATKSRRYRSEVHGSKLNVFDIDSPKSPAFELNILNDGKSTGPW